MSQPESAPATAPHKRGWCRRALRWAGWIALVAAIFHRPLFHLAVPAAARFAAARAHIDLSLHTSGTIFTNLAISSVKARADGTGLTPVRRIEIERMRLDYSVPSLIRHGIGGLLQSYELHQATIEIDAIPSGRKKETKGEKERKHQIARLLNDILGQPAAYADRVLVENFNITVRAPGNVTEVKGVDILLDPEKPGHLRVARLAAPGVPVWENLSATTSYTDRNLFIKELQLAPELTIEQVNFDASRHTQGKGSIMARLRAFGGTAEFVLAGEKLPRKGDARSGSYDTSLRVQVAGVGIDDTLAYFRVPKLPVGPLGRLTRLSVTFAGEPELPRTWKGSAAARVDGTTLGALALDSLELRTAIANGRADFSGGRIAAGGNEVTLTGHAALPEWIGDFPRSDFDAALKLNAADLPRLTAKLPEPFGGAITGGGTVSMHGGRIAANLSLDAQKLANKTLGIGAGKLAVHVSKQIHPPTESPFDELDARITADFSELRFQTFTADALRLGTELQNRAVKLGNLELRRGENHITAEGTATLPAEPAQIGKLPVDAKFAVHVPQLGAFGVTVRGETLAGQVEGAGSLKYVDGALTGGLNLEGGGFALGGFKAEKLAAKIDVANNEAAIDRIAIQLNDTDQLAVTGKAGVAKPFAYEGALLVDIKNLAALQPLLAVFGQAKPLAGALNIDWNGKGEIEPKTHSGEFSVALDKGRFGEIDLTELKLGGIYTPEFLETKPFSFVTGQTGLGGVIELRGRKLRLRDLNLTQAGKQVLSGFAFVPFDPANTKSPFIMDERLAANINTTRLDLEPLLANFGQKSPVTGAITANITAGGTLLQPFAHVRLNAERLQSPALPQLDPASLALDVHFSNAELTVSSTVRQPQLQPLTIAARAPLDLERAITEGKIDPNLPIEATARLPASSLAFVPRVAPQVRRIEGTAALDARVGGTISRPAISGSANIQVSGARLVDENIPSIGGLRARLNFAENVLRFDTFDGQIGGGTFRLGGTLGLANPKDPVFALRLESREVLVKRDDSITVRADTDVRLDGPLKAAAVTGSVFIVRSRFFREIDILPIGLPGRSRPAPKSASSGPQTVSFPQPPLRDWTFDLAIRTRDDDPFLVRGNLANGAAAVNLKLGGTGLAPYLEGMVNVREFVASLPFSRLSVTSGFVAFNREAPFLPTLELQAESQIRDYLVRAFIYGRADDPQVQLSSEPPLPHGDIVSLLATGTTTSELSGNGTVLASRAAMLAIRQLYQKIFRRGAAPPEEPSAGSFQDRFDLELGAVDNRTGTQEVIARFKVRDQIYLIGEVGVDGSATGRVKYLLRFR